MSARRKLGLLGRFVGASTNYERSDVEQSCFRRTLLPEYIAIAIAYYVNNSHFLVAIYRRHERIETLRGMGKLMSWA